MPSSPLPIEYLRQSLDGLLSLATSFGHVEHAGVMGVLRESLIESFLEPLLMPPYRAGSGVVVDSQGKQSGQCDIVIWDDSIFRPLYTARGAGIYLIESVVAFIEVKSTLTRDAFKQSIKLSQDCKDMAILRPPTEEFPNNYWGPEPGILPLNILFGFQSDIIGSERDRAESVAQECQITLWDYLQLVVVPRKEAWLFQAGGAQHFQRDEHHLYHEVLMPFAGMFNSLKKVSEKRGKPNLGAYIVPYQT